MKSFVRLFVVVALALIITAANAFAVGYERIPVQNPRPMKVRPVKVKPVKVKSSHIYSPRDWATVRKATFTEKIPGAIDDAAMSVKGLLNQFGLTLRDRR